MDLTTALFVFMLAAFVGLGIIGANDVVNSAARTNPQMIGAVVTHVSGEGAGV